MEAASRIRSAERVHVIGGPGAGKSSFAAAVADSRSLRLLHLDELAFAGPDFDPRPDDVIRAEVQALAEEGRWVAEGIFVGWVEPLFERADVIVWLDHVTWLQAARRIATRWFSGAVRESSLRRGTERFFRFDDYARNLRHLVRVLATSREYWTNAGAPRRYEVTRAQVDAALARHADKLVHVTRPDEAETMLHLIRSNSGPYGSG